MLENSRFTVTLAERLGATGMHRVLIDLAQGRIESNVTLRLLAVPLPFEIKAPALRMSVRGTRFRAVADPDTGQAQSEVLSGRVRVSAARKAFVLGEGSGSFATLGKAPQPASATWTRRLS